MTKQLVIVESPAKAKKLTSFLGAGWRVEATRGHVRDLPQDSLGIEVDNDLVERSGKHGRFTGCANHPDRGYTRSLEHKPVTLHGGLHPVRPVSSRSTVACFRSG